MSTPIIVEYPTTQGPDNYSGEKTRNMVISSTDIIAFFYWYDDGSGYADIHGKMSKDGGFTWTKLDGTPGRTKITANDSRADEFSVFIDDINNIYIAYTAKSPTYYPKLIKLTYVPASGTWTIGSPRTVDSTLGGAYPLSNVVKDPYSKLWYVIQYISGGNSYIKVYSSTNDGNSWSAGQTLRSVSTSYFLDATLTLVGNRPWVLFTEVAHEDEYYGKLYVSKYNGVSWGSPEEVAGCYYGVHVAKIGTNRLLVSYGKGKLKLWDGVTWIDLYHDWKRCPAEYSAGQSTVPEIRLAVCDNEKTAWIFFTHYNHYGFWYQKLDLETGLFENPSYYIVRDAYYLPSVPEKIPESFLNSNLGSVPALIINENEDSIWFFRIEGQRFIQARARITDNKSRIAKLGTPVQVSSDRIILNPKTTCLFKTSDGKLVVVALDSRASPGVIKYTVSSDEGQHWSAYTTITSNMLQFADVYYNAFLDTNNNIYITYTNRDYNLCFRKLTYSAGSWSVGGEIVVRATDGNLIYFESRIFKNPNTNKLWIVFVVYDQSNYRWWIYTVNSTDDGLNWSTNIPVESTIDNYYILLETAFADFTNDKLCVVYTFTDGNVQQIMVKKSGINGSSWSSINRHCLNEFGGVQHEPGMPFVDWSTGRAYIAIQGDENFDLNIGVYGARWNKVGPEYTYCKWRDTMQYVTSYPEQIDSEDEWISPDPLLVNNELFIISHYPDNFYAQNKHDTISREFRNDNSPRDLKDSDSCYTLCGSNIRKNLAGAYYNYHFPQQNLPASTLNVPFVYLKHDIYNSIWFNTYSFEEYDLRTYQFTAKGNIRRIEADSISAKARLFPPLAVQTAISAAIRKIRVKLEIKWNGIDWVDETSRFISSNINTQMESNLGQSIAGEMDIEVENTDYRFSAGYGSPIDEYLKPRVAIRLFIDFDNIGYYIPLFTGYIKAYKPDTSTGICNLHCFDNFRLILNKPATRKIYTNIYTHQAIEELLLMAGLTEEQYVLEKGTQIIPVVWTEDRFINPLISELSAAERGRAFFDELGIFRFWNKDHLHNLPSLLGIKLTKENWLLNINYEIAEQAIKNDITIKAQPRVSTGTQVVWSNGDCEVLNPFTDTLIFIPPNGYQNAWIETEDPCIGWIRPVPNSDYIANTEPDGSGRDITNYVSISTFDTYDTSVFLQVINRYNGPCYFRKFNIRANPLKVYKWIRVREIDAASIELYDQQTIEIENNFINDEGLASDIAKEELRRWKSAKNNFKAKIIGIPYLRCGDVIATQLANDDYDDFMISEMTTVIDENGYTQELSLVEPLYVPEEQEVAGRGDIKKNISYIITAKAVIKELPV